jgi:hypothetical protein
MRRVTPAIAPYLMPGNGVDGSSFWRRGHFFTPTLRAQVIRFAPCIINNICRPFHVAPEWVGRPFTEN